MCSNHVDTLMHRHNPTDGTTRTVHSKHVHEDLYMHDDKCDLMIMSGDGDKGLEIHNQQAKHMHSSMFESFFFDQDVPMDEMYSLQLSTFTGVPSSSEAQVVTRRREIPITCMELCVEGQVGESLSLESFELYQPTSETMRKPDKGKLLDVCVDETAVDCVLHCGGMKECRVISMELLKQTTMDFVLSDGVNFNPDTMEKVAQCMTDVLSDTGGLLDPTRTVSAVLLRRMLEVVVYGRQDSKRVKMIGNPEGDCIPTKKRRKTTESSCTSKEKKGLRDGGDMSVSGSMKLNGPLSRHTFISTICLTVVCYLRTCREWPRKTSSVVSGGNHLTEKSIMQITADLSEWFTKDPTTQEALEIFMQETSPIWMFSPNSYLAKYTESGVDILQMYTKKGRSKEKKESLVKLLGHQLQPTIPVSGLGVRVTECLETGAWFHLGNFIREGLADMHNQGQTTDTERQKHPFRHIMHALPGVLSEDVAWKVSVACMFNQVLCPMHHHCRDEFAMTVAFSG